MKKTLLLLLPLLMLCSCNNEKTNTPLGWCVWEIQKHEGYENCALCYAIYVNNAESVNYALKLFKSLYEVIIDPYKDNY